MTPPGSPNGESQGAEHEAGPAGRACRGAGERPRAGDGVPPSDRNAGADRVVLVGPLPPPSGGMANQTRQLARLLGDEGIKVDVVQVNAPYYPPWVEHVKGVRALFRLLPYLFRLVRATRSAAVVHVMANSGWAWHLFAAPAVWIASLRGLPVVVNYRGGEAEHFFGRQFGWVRPTLARARAVIVPSGFLSGVFAKYGVITTIVPNIVDLALFSPAQRAPESPHVIVTRNLEPIYDIGTALRAFALVRAKCPAARMTVAGSGPSRAQLETLARELGIGDAVRFAGRIENAELPELYRTASIALNPSLADNMPISVLEAMASGVPVVSSNVGGVPFMVEDGQTGLLAPPRDAAAMATAIGRILADDELRDRLVRNGREAAAQYAWTKVRERLLAVYAAVRGGARCAIMS